MIWGLGLDSELISGNMLELSQTPSAEQAIPYALGFWANRELGEAVACWVLQKANFWRIIKPFQIQHMSGDEIENIGCLITPQQIRQRSCLLPGEEELYYREKILTNEQLKTVSRWDYLALRIQKSNDRFEAYPCLIDFTTQKHREEIMRRGWYMKSEEDIERAKESGFRVFKLEVTLNENWSFTASLEEM